MKIIRYSQLMNKYEDIIHLEHHTSDKHPRMSMYARAAQFSSFAALNGHKEALKKTAEAFQAEVESADKEDKEEMDKI